MPYYDHFTKAQAPAGDITLASTPTLEVRIGDARRLLSQGDFTPSAGLAFDILEEALREMFRRNLGLLDGAARRRVAEVESKLGAGRLSVEQFTLGKLAELFRESKFLNAWAQATNKELRGVRFINLDEMARLRNEMRHGGHYVTRREAELIMSTLESVVETFEILSISSDSESAASDERSDLSHDYPPRSKSSYTPNNELERDRLNFQSELFREADRRLLLRALEIAQPSPRLRVLDVGTADGLHAEQLWASCNQGIDVLVGLDRDAAAIDRARTRGTREIIDAETTYLCGDVEQDDDLTRLGLDETMQQPFDVITIFATLQHLADPARSLRRLSRLLRPGGVIVARAPDDDLMVSSPDPSNRLRRTLELSRNMPGASNRTFGRSMQGCFYRAGFRSFEAIPLSFTTTGLKRAQRSLMYQTFFRHRRLTMERALKAHPGDVELISRSRELSTLLDELELDFEDETHFFLYCEIGLIAIKHE